jgi:ribulose-phosphate 3-epimerase
MSELKNILIAPSVLSSDFGKLNDEIASVEKFVDWIHLDLMDNHFVPNLTFGVPIIKWIKTGLKMDAHLMVEHPEQYLKGLAEVGVYSVTVHVEACPHLHRVVTQIQELGMKAAVALNPGTSVESLNAILPFIDMVLVMSVNPGFGGQKFIGEVVEKIKYIKKNYPDVLVQVDGGVNAETAVVCKEAGADVLVAGSYIFKAEDREAAIASLRG